ncbi:MAG: hypothetical protein JJLCMIEE_03368 [Acidimicrobiales bacterium]|nr:MAG: Fe-S cluster assembly protein SufD [Actinomycetota bacterium]MBV6510237.1 hypothetical protein [Acidimicrobiales bacterium]RIK04203.1 MAG: Fe-S cluster assembly protein SufD [Acidobacteriota bacterium]
MTPVPFEVESARSLPGPRWLRDRRASAAATLAGAELPTTEEEVWRYSRIAELELGAFRLVEHASGDEPEALRPVIDLVPERAGVIVVRNGRVVRAELADDLASKGVFFGALAEAENPSSLLGSVASAGPDVFALMNDAFAADPVALVVPSGVVVEAPFAVAHWIDEEAAAVLPRLVVTTGEGSEISVLEYYGSAAVTALMVPLVELSVGPAARVGYVGVQDLAPSVWQVGSHVSAVDRSGVLRSAAAMLGGDYARLRMDCRLVGRGAQGDLMSVYFGEGHQTLDLRTFQDHRAPDTSSELTFKGAVSGSARSIYTGLIKVEPDARGTNARQSNRLLKLSEDAWAESVPNLEIETNDVRCSHASAVGPVDEDQRFYLESRGVKPEVAQRLVVTGFFEEVLAQLPVPGVGEPLRARIIDKLEGGGA